MEPCLGFDKHRDILFLAIIQWKRDNVLLKLFVKCEDLSGKIMSQGASRTLIQMKWSIFAKNLDLYTLKPLITAKKIQAVGKLDRILSLFSSKQYSNIQHLDQG